MTELFGISSPALLGQLLIGVINGAFYAILSLGLAVIFGLLNLINFAHGAQYMLGAFAAWFLLRWGGVNYWWALICAPLLVGLFGMLLERLLLRRLYSHSQLYGLLFTFGLALALQGLLTVYFGSSGQPYPYPREFAGAFDLGFMMLPKYRAWVIVAATLVCLCTWFVIERTKLGSYLRAASENPSLVEAFGINVPRLVTLTYGLGVALAAFAGVMAAPIYQVSPSMGADLIIVVFAVVVIGGMGSILGSVVTGFGLGIIEGLTKVFYPEASNTVIFVLMAVVLLVKPAGLFGKELAPVSQDSINQPADQARVSAIWIVAMVAAFAIAPRLGIYPLFLMKALCFALFACAFNLLIGFGGLLSFGHAMFFGIASYICAHAAKAWGLPPELSILTAVALSAALGFAAAAVAVRRQGIYFAMITLALAQMVYFFCLQARFTGGEDGIQRVPRGHLFGVIDLSNTTTMYYFVLAVFVCGFLLILRVVNSPFGRILKAIRENEPRAISLGYDAERFKTLAFVLSAALSGLAGATKALVFQSASLTDVHWTMSGEVILMTLLGGLGTVFGPVVGAFALVALAEYLAGLGQWVVVTLGATFMLCVLLFRQGLVGTLLQWRAQWPVAFLPARKAQKPAN